MVLVDVFELIKGDIRIWLFEKRYSMKFEWWFKVYRNWEMYNYRLILRGIIRWNFEEFF